MANQKVQKRKPIIKNVYLDTCVILNYVEDRTDESVVFIESIKSRKWRLRTSTFTLTELSDYKKNSIYFWAKLSERKSLNLILKKARDTRLNKKLTDNQLTLVEKWVDDIGENILPNLDYLDLDGSAWRWAKMLSVKCNISAKDSIHLATALASAINEDCDYFITDDADLKKEANNLIRGTKMASFLQVMSTKEFIADKPPLKSRLKPKKTADSDS